MRAPPPTPLLAVLRLVWASLSVRRGRHLITALSVVLAVAFLVSVAGEAIATRAVALADAAERRAADQAQTLRIATITPRPTTAWLELIIQRPEELQTWLTNMDAAVPNPISPLSSTAREALELLQWVQQLSTGRAWIVTRSDHPLTWVLSLDSPERCAHLSTVLAGLPGARLPWPHERLTAYALHVTALRSVLATCEQAEQRRLERLKASSGSDTHLAHIEAGTARIDDPLLPIAHLLLDWSNDDVIALRTQLRLDRLRQAAQAELSERARKDPAAFDEHSVSDWLSLTRTLTEMVSQRTPVGLILLTRAAPGALEPAALQAAGNGDQPARQAVLAALNAALDDPALAHPGAWKDRELPAEAARLIGPDAATLAPRIRSRLNRLLLGVVLPSVTSPMAPVSAEIERVDDASAAGEAARASLKTALGADDAASVVAEQTRRERRAALAAAFAARGGDPLVPDARRLALAALALLVCAVGVVNALLMAIYERFREIATMKCLGARDGFIVRSVLWEAAAVGLAGAIPGAALGVTAVVMQASARYGEAFWGALPTGMLTLVAIGSALVGVGLALFGAALPARIAARMQPVQALRVEA